MTSLCLKPSGADRLTYAMSVAALCLALGGHANRVAAAPEAKPTTSLTRTVSLTQLEQAFWICDHAATKGMIDGSSAVICGRVTDELKNTKFSGDFDSMVTWWRQNKPAQHTALDNASEHCALTTT